MGNKLIFQRSFLISYFPSLIIHPPSCPGAVWWGWCEGRADQLPRCDRCWCQAVKCCHWTLPPWPCLPGGHSEYNQMATDNCRWTEWGTCLQCYMLQCCRAPALVCCSTAMLPLWPVSRQCGSWQYCHCSGPCSRPANTVPQFWHQYYKLSTISTSSTSTFWLLKHTIIIWVFELDSSLQLKMEYLSAKIVTNIQF